MHAETGYAQLTDVPSEDIAVAVADDPQGDGFPELWLRREGEAIARRLARRRWSAIIDDLVSAAKVINFKRLREGKFNPDYRWAQWTTVTSKNAIKDECKAKRNRGIVKQWNKADTVEFPTDVKFDPTAPPTSRTFGANLEGDEPDPYDEVVMDDTTELVRNALAKISNDNYRMVLDLHTAQCYSAAETATILGWVDASGAPDTRKVNNAHDRAKTKLAKLIEAEAIRARLITEGDD